MDFVQLRQVRLQAIHACSAARMGLFWGKLTTPRSCAPFVPTLGNWPPASCRILVEHTLAVCCG
jgi:hypothetical protein